MKTGTCYICRRKDLMDGHHIVPQAFGGEKGPVVDLDATCHRKIHAQALNFESKNPNQLLFSAEEWTRAKALVDYIILEIRENRDNPNFNNPSTLMLKLTKYDIYLLHLMKGDAGYTNLQDYAKDLIKAFIKSKFPTV